MRGVILANAKLMVVLILCFVGCASPPTKNNAVEVAKKEVIKRGWGDFKIESVRRIQKYWRVEIWELPETPGGTAEVDVSDDGTVLAYWPGM